MYAGQCKLFEQLKDSCLQYDIHFINKVLKSIYKIIITTCVLNMDQNLDNDFAMTRGDSFEFRNQSTYQMPHQNYTTSINELIAQPNMPSTTEYFLATLFNLSHYLFQKKKRGNQNENEMSFQSYLNSFSNEIVQYDNLHKKAKISSKQLKLDMEENKQQLLQCYQRVPFAFFKQNFILDFGQLAKNINQIKRKQQQLNDDLDLVQINLFSQIHHKFHEYFKVVANFQYLNESLDVNIKKNKEARMRINKVKVDFIEKAANLKKKIVHRQNLQKAIKTTRIIKSLKKLPLVIKQILQSSLPYECLSLLKSTKQSLLQVHGLRCLAKTSQTIRESQSLVQMGLNKRYADQLYIYLEECQGVSLQQSWDRINSNGCVDISGMNNSYMGVSGILQESILEMQPSTSKNKRNQGKQFEIAMILLQSYRFIDFPADLIRIKVSNSLRIFCKRFDTQLAECLTRIIDQKHQQILLSKQEPDRQHTSEQIKITRSFSTPIPSEQESALSGIVQKVTIIFYVKHLFIFNQIMKDTMDRFLGYLFTLLTQYKESKMKDQGKFVNMFKQELSILPAITKIIIEKLIFLMSLKNINGISFPQFRQWISLLQYWKRYTDGLIEQNPLINYQDQISQIQQVINDTFKKMISILNIDSTINELVLNFITAYHANTMNSELEPSFVEQSWQAVEIPSEFVDVLNNIAQWQDPQNNHNTSVTILNDSRDMKSMNRSLSQDYGNKRSTKFRVLKSNVMVDGVRYKISVSLLLLCEFVEEYVKMSRSMPDCRKFIYQRMFDLIQFYNNRTKELILEAKARQYQKMKQKNISAKHICLVHNCLSVVLKLIKEMNYPQLNQLKEITINNVENHKKQLINKLSYLLKSKVDSTIASFLLNKDQKVAQVNLNLLNVFVQMLGIIDDYLDAEDKKATFRDAIEIFMSKYFKELLLKGTEFASENRLLLQKMRFLKPYFPEELMAMQKEVKAMPTSQNQI